MKAEDWAKTYGVNRALVADLATAEAKVARLRDLLLEIWDSVPATHEDSDPAVMHHAKALNRIIPVLADRDHSRIEARRKAGRYPMELREKVAMRMAYDTLVLYSSLPVEEWWKHYDERTRRVWRKKADAILALVAEDRRELVGLLYLYEREHAKQFKPLDCQCSYCKQARAALAKEGVGG